MLRLATVGLALAALLVTAVMVRAQPDLTGGEQQTTSTETPPVLQWEPIRWRRSRAVGLPWRGRLARGVLLPAQGPDFFTWDPPLKRSPNRSWRRWGHDRLIRTLLRVVSAYHRANPGAARVGIGDISRPHGGNFGKRYGGLGHRSHQSGLDVDVYYPRWDGLERRASRASQIDLDFAQDLVDRFVAAGAKYVFVGPRLDLEGPRRRVVALAFHDDHMHVRFRPRPGGR